MIDYDQILPNLYVGTYPETAEDLRELKVRGITAVLNVQTDEDFRDRGIDWPEMEDSYRSVGLEVNRVPMRDFDPEDQRQQLPEAVSTLAALLAKGHIVYLHCNAGTGRSPLVAMAYLHGYSNMSRRQAIKHVRDRRYCVPYEDLLNTVPKSSKD
jgi:atypical dual specificity phosphatase